MIHELVWESHKLGKTLESIIGNKKGYEVLNHLDGDKWNPALKNLDWVKQGGKGGNMCHAYKHGLRKPRT